jgi:hypothetical protein
MGLLCLPPNGSPPLPSGATRRSCGPRCSELCGSAAPLDFGGRHKSPIRSRGEDRSLASLARASIQCGEVGSFAVGAQRRVESVPGRSETRQGLLGRSSFSWIAPASVGRSKRQASFRRPHRVSRRSRPPLSRIPDGFSEQRLLDLRSARPDRSCQRHEQDGDLLDLSASQQARHVSSMLGETYQAG